MINPYRVVVPEEQAMLGNDILFKCSIPSFVADFVSTVGWEDSENAVFSERQNSLGKSGFMNIQL